MLFRSAPQVLFLRVVAAVRCLGVVAPLVGSPLHGILVMQPLPASSVAQTRFPPRRARLAVGVVLLVAVQVLAQGMLVACRSKAAALAAQAEV